MWNVSMTLIQLTRYAVFSPGECRLYQLLYKNIIKMLLSISDSATWWVTVVAICGMDHCYQGESHDTVPMLNSWYASKSNRRSCGADFVTLYGTCTLPKTCSDVHVYIAIIIIKGKTTFLPSS